MFKFKRKKPKEKESPKKATPAKKMAAASKKKPPAPSKAQGKSFKRNPIPLSPKKRLTAEGWKHLIHQSIDESSSE